VRGGEGVLVIDPGVHDDELVSLANELSDSRQSVVAGFSTHPHWDHLLWHPGLGAAPRYGTDRCAATVRDRLSGDVEAVAKAAGIPDRVPLDLLGQITGLPAGTAHLPWDGPAVRILEHQAHAPGHAALVIAERGVLVAGDMLSDVLIPMLDPRRPGQVEAYETALDRLDAAAGRVDVLVPGHGAVARGREVAGRFAADRAYIGALRRGEEPVDARLDQEWLAGPHRSNVELARQSAG